LFLALVLLHFGSFLIVGFQTKEEEEKAKQKLMGEAVKEKTALVQSEQAIERRRTKMAQKKAAKREIEAINLYQKSLNEKEQGKTSDEIVLATQPSEVVLQVFGSYETNFSIFNTQIFLILLQLVMILSLLAMVLTFQYYLFVIYFDDTSGITFEAKRYLLNALKLFCGMEISLFCLTVLNVILYLLYGKYRLSILTKSSPIRSVDLVLVGVFGSCMCFFIGSICFYSIEIFLYGGNKIAMITAIISMVPIGICYFGILISLICSLYQVDCKQICVTIIVHLFCAFVVMPIILYMSGNFFVPEED